jgi:NO-binding membrane sensor protein with MHYT domain
MGGIGIWCMHFIGNRAIILSHGESHAQIVYSSGYTAVSFFLPIAVLLGAFYFIGISEGASPWRITLGGVLTGLAVCGMHYVGQLGIANYTCIYDWPHVLGAAIIAVLASLVALSVFFRLRVAWTNIWWKRAACACILAGAVSGMHWLAIVGTLYRYRGLSRSAQSQFSRQQIVIVVLVLVSCPFPSKPSSRS